MRINVDKSAKFVASHGKIITSADFDLKGLGVIANYKCTSRLQIPWDYSGHIDYWHRCLSKVLFLNIIHDFIVLCLPILMVIMK